MNDVELYQRACRREPAAIQALVRKHATTVLAMIKSSDLLELAEDALQEAWIRVLASDCGFTGGSFSSWLALIARRNLLEMHRKSGREPMGVRWRESTRASRRIYFDQVIMAIDRLPNPDHREVAKLHWIQGLSSYEIGRMLETPAKTVQSRILAAREELVRMLNTPLSSTSSTA